MLGLPLNKLLGKINGMCDCHVHNASGIWLKHSQSQQSVVVGGEWVKDTIILWLSSLEHPDRSLGACTRDKSCMCSTISWVGGEWGQKG